jgi:hypothetical protein
VVSTVENKHLVGGLTTNLIVCINLLQGTYDSLKRKTPPGVHRAKKPQEVIYVTGGVNIWAWNRFIGMWVQAPEILYPMGNVFAVS